MGFLWAGDIMRLLLLIAINLHTSIVSSRKHVSASDESIENLLYYRDCNHRAKETTEAPAPIIEPMAAPKKEPECPFPKMCCSMSCGNDCGSQSNQQSFLSRQMEPLQNLEPIIPKTLQPRQSQIPVQPQIMQRGRKKKLNAGLNMLPIEARRGFGFTKEKIKSVISQDEDIRKILKDLVRVTMQKVDLMEMVKFRRSNVAKSSETSLNSDDSDSYVH